MRFQLMNETSSHVLHDRPIKNIASSADTIFFPEIRKARKPFPRKSKNEKWFFYRMEEQCPTPDTFFLPRQHSDQLFPCILAGLLHDTRPSDTPRLRQNNKPFHPAKQTHIRTGYL